MKIFITGYRGYIGSRLFNKLDNGFSVVHGMDLKDGRDILHHLPNTSYDYIFHLAAFPSVQKSVNEPSDTFRNNAYATSVLLEWAKNHNVKRVIFPLLLLLLMQHHLMVFKRKFQSKSVNFILNSMD